MNKQRNHVTTRILLCFASPLPVQTARDGDGDHQRDNHDTCGERVPEPSLGMIRDSPVGRLRPVQHTNLKGSRGTADLVPNTNQIGRAAYCPCSCSRNSSSAGVKKKTGGERGLRKELISLPAIGGSEHVNSDIPVGDQRGLRVAQGVGRTQSAVVDHGAPRRQSVSLAATQQGPDVAIVVRTRDARRFFRLSLGPGSLFWTAGIQNTERPRNCRRSVGIGCRYLVGSFKCHD